MTIRKSIWGALLSGILVVVPVYLTVLLLLKAISSVGALVQPIAKLMPDWLPGEALFSLLLILVVCFLVGAAARTRIGRKTGETIESSVFRKLPGYASIRGLTRQIAGGGQETTWKPALAEIEEALVPAFIIEELADGRFTCFVPSVPTPLAGAIYVLTPERVHRVAVPFTQAARVISGWGVGCKDLVAAIEPPQAVRRQAELPLRQASGAPQDAVIVSPVR